MKATIYALVDPNTHQVRYVGRTRKTINQRLKHHIASAKSGVKSPVYDWIRSLQVVPVVVVLQDGIDVKRNTSGAYSTRRYWTTDAAAETKWMKRFERSQLLCAIPRDSGVYKSLTNPHSVKAMRRLRH